MVTQVKVLKSLNEEDETYVESTDAERASLDVLASCFEKMSEDAASGS